MIPEEIKNKIIAHAQNEYGDETPHQHWQQSLAIRHAEYGYSLAVSEIEALKKEVERVKELLEAKYRQYTSSYFQYKGLKDINGQHVQGAWNEFKKNNNL